MPIQVDATELSCAFCNLRGLKTPLVRSMHGLYCVNEKCYSRVTDGNLVPPVECEKCGENSFYYEKDGTLESAAYLCISCAFETST